MGSYISNIEWRLDGIDLKTLDVYGVFSAPLLALRVDIKV
jgi:hypothetical protein